MWSVSIEYTGERKLSDGARVKTASVWIRDEQENTITDTSAYDVWPLSPENQALLESAPDLLEQIKKLRDQYTKVANAQDAAAHDWHGMYAVEDAIKRAEGRL